MACRTAVRSVFLTTEPWGPVRRSFTSESRYPFRRTSSVPRSRGGFRIARAPGDFHLSRPIRRISSSDNDNASVSGDEQGPPQEAILKAIAEVSKAEGRVGQTTNVVIGGTVTHDATNEWLELDQKVNSYPTVRGFTAIGTGGDDFVQSMVVAVESVIQQPIPEGRITQKISSRGKYVSVNIGPVRVVSSEQVQAVYNAMRRDDRMKYFL
uniref:Uncharacterized protein n=1 Tax=Kalanchoe fedtschenkoi TaxID=63787 RepID=A0A7N0UX75_KALFE